jgi:RimJ/RimL family protein N-acetyltransferase
MNNPYIVGKHIYLRHPTEADVLGGWHEWFSDEETTKYIGDRYWPNSREAQLEFYQSTINSRSRLLLSIVDIASDKHIGVCSLSNISWVHRYGDMALVIGDKDFRKGPYAFECCSLMLRIAFLRLNFKTVRGGYAAVNEYTEKLLAVLRFRQVGTYKEMFWADGKYQDYVICQISAEDWLKSHEVSPDKLETGKSNG